MSLETGNYIGDLVGTNPTGTDQKKQGDDHIRFTKTAAKNTFAGYSGAVLVTATDSGTAAAHTLTPATALVSYVAPMMLNYRPNVTNTGAVTVNVSGLGAKSIKTATGSDPSPGDIIAGVPLLLVYDGINFVISGGTGYLSKTGTQTYTGTLTINGALIVTSLDVPTQAPNNNSTKAASTAYVDAAAMSAALPNQAGNAGKVITTDGTTAFWANLFPDYLVMARGIK